MINTFWSEFDEFQSKNGVYKNRQYIFKNHSDLLNSKSFIWHKKETERFTQFFGAFACRVCSKILGIGSAERSWGDVKQLKDNKRSHLSGDRVKKQATIYGRSCVELAKYRRAESYKDVSTKPLKIWTDDDFKASTNEEHELQTNTINAPPQRIFKAYIEDWENTAITKKDVVNEAKLLKKYGGLSWMDPDDKNNVLLRSDTKVLDWTRVCKKTGGGYCVRALEPDYDENDPKKKENFEPWLICDILINEIAHYYKNNPDKGVVVEESPDTNNNRTMNTSNHGNTGTNRFDIDESETDDE